MENIYVSKHGYERFDQRFDANSREVCQSIAERAWRNGKTPDCFTGRMKKYLMYIETKHNDHTVIKVHSKNCYVFGKDGTLVTVYRIHSYDKYATQKPSRYRECLETA